MSDLQQAKPTVEEFVQGAVKQAEEKSLQAVQNAYDLLKEENVRLETRLEKLCIQIEKREGHCSVRKEAKQVQW